MDTLPLVGGKLSFTVCHKCFDIPALFHIIASIEKQNTLCNQNLIKMKSFSFLFVVAALTLFSTGPTLVVADESCASGEGECANPDVISEEENPDVAPEVEAPVATEVEVPDDTPKAEEDPNCPSRDLIIRCAGKYLDTNKNGKLDRPELQGAIDSLPWYARGILQILGSVDKMVS